MEDSSLFLQWAMDTLRHEHEQPAAAAAVNDDCSSASEATTFPSLQALREAAQAAEMVQELIAEAPANSWSSGDTTDGSISGGNSNSPPAAAAAMDHDVWSGLRPRTRRPADAPSAGAVAAPAPAPTIPPLSWNFSAAAAASPQLGGGNGMLPEFAPKRAVALPVNKPYGSPPARKAGLKSLAGSMAAPYAQDHIIAERKRREKINQRFIELSTVIPGLKKMDKATILSDATKYVKELQEKIKDMDGGSSRRRSIEIEAVVLVKRPCLHAAAPAPDGDDGSPLAALPGSPAETKTQQLPEIEARFSENTVMVRIHCEDGRGVSVKVLAEVEELHLSILHVNLLPFAQGTLSITIMAKLEEGFTVTAEEIVGRLNSALLLHNATRPTTTIIDAATALMSDEETIS